MSEKYQVLAGYCVFFNKEKRKMRVILLLILALASFTVSASTDSHLKQLEEYISRRDEFMQRKQHRLDSIKSAIQAASPEEQLPLIDKICNEYRTFCYDSAFVYVNRELNLAKQLGRTDYVYTAQISKSLLMATSGFYSQAESEMLSIDIDSLNSKTLFYYHYAMAWLYGYWNSYCSDDYFSPMLSQKQREHLRLAIEALDSIEGNQLEMDNPEAMKNYLRGEQAFMNDRSDRSSIKYYQLALDNSKIDQRLYACASYALARSYKMMGRKDLYEQYLVGAAISDIVCPLKENLALQELSMYLFEKDKNNAETAARYINFAMDDAQFYNNRLRIIEISKIMPVITAAYNDLVKRQERYTSFALMGVSMLAIALLIMLYFLRRQNTKLHLSRAEVSNKVHEMELLNEKLRLTNHKRETYLSLFMDISAAYINKLQDMRKFVVRKLKVGDTSDLYRQMNSYKAAEEEYATFNTRFDKAFLELYPNFVDELNNLLCDGCKIVLPTPTSLTTEVRIYALMRLGVTESQKIATLLFYSPQTIYNYKTAMRNKAKNRDTFEDDVNKLCKIIS